MYKLKHTYNVALNTKLSFKAAFGSHLVTFDLVCGLVTSDVVLFIHYRINHTWT
jgi:hypothetical protein